MSDGHAVLGHPGMPSSWIGSSLDFFASVRVTVKFLLNLTSWLEDEDSGVELSMQEVYTHLWIAGDQECRSGDGEWAIVHACKSPCHQQAVGYQGSLPPSHENYLALIRGQDLFLNLIDPPRPLFKLKSFTTFLDFAEAQWEAGRRLLIHCNQGESRAPSLALLFLAKSRSALDNSSYLAARSQFERLCPNYRPGA